MVMHTTGHSNIDCYVTHYSGPEVFVKTCVALKLVDDDDVNMSLNTEQE